MPMLLLLLLLLLPFVVEHAFDAAARLASTLAAAHLGGAMLSRGLSGSGRFRCCGSGRILRRLGLGSSTLGGGDALLALGVGGRSSLRRGRSRNLGDARIFRRS